MGYNTKNWKEFKVGDVFDVRGAKKSDRLQDDGGKYPSITQSSENNGMNGTDSSFTEKGNVIQMENNIKGKAFYQPTNYFIGKNITNGGSVITIKGTDNIISRNIGIYLVALFDRNMSLYSYGFKRSMTRLKNEKIKLPEKPDGSVDWDFIEEQGRLAEREVLKESELYKKIKEMKELSFVKNIDIKNWKDFQLKDIFKISSSRPTKKDLTRNLKIDPINGYKVVHGGFGNYGVETERYILDSSIKIIKGNCITLARTSQHSFYRSDDFITRDSIAILRSKNLNRYNGLFISSILSKNEGYEFGRKRLMKNVQKEIIKLPAKPDGSVDWDFMEEQGRLAEIEVLKESPLYDRIKKIIDEDK